MSKKYYLALTFAVCLSLPALADEAWQTEPFPTGSIAGTNGFELPTVVGAENAKDILVLDQVQAAFDNSSPSEGVRRFQYSEAHVMKINLRRHIVTRIKLPEIVDEAALGDATLFGVRHEHGDSYVDVWPVVAGVDSNLIVQDTHGRIFTFYVRALPVDSTTVPDLTVLVSEVGPYASPLSLKPDQKVENLENPEAEKDAQSVVSGPISDGRGESGAFPTDFVDGIPFDAAKVNYEFKMYGDRSIAPDRVFTDGVWTYLYYDPERFHQVDLPVPFRLVDGIDTPVNYRIGKSLIAVEAVGEFSLINGHRIVCVVPDFDHAYEVEAEGQYGGSAPAKPETRFDLFSWLTE